MKQVHRSIHNSQEISYQDEEQSSLGSWSIFSSNCGKAREGFVWAEEY